jgi:hypothetical protein
MTHREIDLARSKERREDQAADMKDRQEHVAINSETSLGRSPPVWNWSRGRFICSGVASTTPMIYHNGQALTQNTIQRDEVPFILPPKRQEEGEGTCLVWWRSAMWAWRAVMVPGGDVFYCVMLISVMCNVCWCAAHPRMSDGPPKWHLLFL